MVEASHRGEASPRRWLAGRPRSPGQSVRLSLFGSYARGKADLFTDLDVLVIMETALPFVQRLGMLYQLAASSVDLDILCYTPQEFQTMKDGPFLRQAVRDEKILYEKKPA